MCGFRKSHSTQHALFKLLTSWQNSIDRGGLVGYIRMDLSKAYVCLPHNLLLAKLQAYGFSKESIKLFLSYLTNRTQRIKIGSTFSHWTNILKGIPQGSILVPLLLNIFVNNLFFFSAKCEICNFADDNSLYSCGMNLDNIFSNLLQDMENVNEWFVCSSMKANPDKFHFNILGNTGSHTLKIGAITIKSASYVTLLCITIDSKSNFKEHINNIVKKAYYKLYALRRLRKFLTLEKAKILACSMIESQFAYCPLIWMFYSKTDMQRVEKVQYKSLQVVYNNYMATYDELFALDNKLKIHQRHLQFLAIEIFKSKKKLNRSFMWKTYKEKNIPYSLRRGISLFIPNANTQKYGINSLTFRGSVLWDNLPIKLKECKSLQEFKLLLKQSGNLPYTCSACKA